MHIRITYSVVYLIDVCAYMLIVNPLVALDMFIIVDLKVEGRC